MSDIEQRLREAHPISQQYASGSKILLEAADEIAALQARVAELEHSLTELIQHYSETWDLPILERAEAARDGAGYPWLLRMQAEAMESAIESGYGFTQMAKVLRQQADEIEGSGTA